MSARTRIPRQLGTRGFAIAAFLMAALVVAQLVTIVTVSGLASRQVDDAALDTFEYVGDLVVEQVDQYARQASDVVSDVALLMQRDSGLEQEVLQAVLVDQLRGAESLRAVYVGTSQGDFLSVTRTYQGYEVEETSAAMGRSTVTSYDWAGEHLDSVMETSFYDPRTRPWYRTAAVATETVWSPLYLDYGTFSTVASPAHAVRADSAVTAVVAADVDVAHLRELLDGLPYGAGASAFVVSPAGEVLAAPDSYTVTLSQLAAQSERVPLLGEVGVTMGSAPLSPGQARFAKDGGQMTLDQALPVTAGVDWQVHLEADTAQLSAGLGRLGVALWWVVGLSVLVTAIAIALAWSVRHSMGHMRTRASTDHLTGVANRREYEHAGAELLAQAAVRGEDVLAVAIDLDDFKALNDGLGHHVGDQALAAVGRALRASVRETDVAARIGGDEFVVLQRLHRIEDPEAIVDRIRETIARELAELPELTEVATVTVGFAMREGSMDLPALTAAADAALLRGKRTAKGRVYRA